MKTTILALVAAFSLSSAALASPIPPDRGQPSTQPSQTPPPRQTGQQGGNNQNTTGTSQPGSWQPSNPNTYQPSTPDPRVNE